MVQCVKNMLKICRKCVYAVGRKGKGHNNYEKEIISNIADSMHGAYHDAERGVCRRGNGNS